MSLSKRPTWDVFVSHNRKQKAWVREVVKQWTSLGRKVFFDEESIEPGESTVDGILRGLKGSRYVVLFLTPESAKSRWVSMERAMTLYDDPNAQERKLIPVILEPVDVPESIAYLNRLDLSVSNLKERKRQYHKLLRKLGVTRRSLPSPPPYQRRSSKLEKAARPFCLSATGKVLAIGAHWDDILLGCFGTLLKLRLLYNYEVTLYVLCNDYPEKYYGVPQPDLDKRVDRIFNVINRRHEINCNVNKKQGRHNLISDRNFHSSSQILHTLMKQIAREHENSNLIFTPPIDDGHEDHAFTGQLVFSYFRKTYQTKLEYESKRYLEKHFVPNIFIGLDDVIGSRPYAKTSIGDLKINLLSKLITDPKTGIAGSSFLFGIESLRARLITHALDYGGDKNVIYGEAFRGRISI